VRKFKDKDIIILSVTLGFLYINILNHCYFHTDRLTFMLKMKNKVRTSCQQNTELSVPDF